EIFEIAVWTHGGDADGNPNINAEILEYGYKSLKKNNFPAKIDIRHDANEIIDCIQWIFKKFDIILTLKSISKYVLFVLVAVGMFVLSYYFETGLKQMLLLIISLIGVGFMIQLIPLKLFIHSIVKT
ncbi:MAG: hypothetical protein EB100_05215, partial [Crocinitomicaceae bacterium]|nr:hypothetical protein [Crocinitomicaceae bacterium]